MKMNKYIIGASLIGCLSLGGIVLTSANEKITTVDGKEVIQTYNNLINQEGVEHVVLDDVNGTTLEVYRDRVNGYSRVDYYDENGMLVDRRITTDFGASFLTLSQFQTDEGWEFALTKILPPKNAVLENKELMKKSIIDGYFQEEFVDGIYRDWVKTEVDAKTNLIKYSDDSNNIYVDSNTGRVTKREVIVEGEVVKTFDVEVIPIDKAKSTGIFQMDAPLLKPNSVADNKKLRTLNNELEVTVEDYSDVEYDSSNGKG